MKWLCTFTVVALTACGSAVERGGEQREPLISIHLASEREQAGYEPVEFEARALFIVPEPIVSDDEIAAVGADRGENSVLLNIEMTSAGADQLRRATAENIGRPLVLKFGGEIVGAPIIRSELTGAHGQLLVPAHSEVQATEIVERVRSRWPG